MKNQVVRVAVNNNFNCTENEWTQLDQFAKENPDKIFFVNSNINTPQLGTIANHNYKAVLTLNPDLHCNLCVVLGKLVALQRHHIAFTRIKYIPEAQDIKDLIRATLQYGLPVVITLQRFNSKVSLEKYTDSKFYKHSCSRYRLAGPELNQITSTVTQMREFLGYPIWICDEKGLGCSGCQLCSLLPTGTPDCKIMSLNLSSSGICPYSCPDCYAKTMQHFVKAMGHQAIAFNTIKQNYKQSGRTGHIKKHLKKG